jgi:hypothetical protein
MPATSLCVNSETAAPTSEVVELSKMRVLVALAVEIASTRYSWVERLQSIWSMTAAAQIGAVHSLA